MVGLDNAGKTTALFRLHLGETVATQPTLGSNVESVKYQNLQFEIWDLAGQVGVHGVGAARRDRRALTSAAACLLNRNERPPHACCPLLAPPPPRAQANLRPSWAAYYAQTQAVIVVVDSTDRARMGIVKNELSTLLADSHLEGACILILVRSCGGAHTAPPWAPSALARCLSPPASRPLLSPTQANKQDLKDAMSVSELSEALGLPSIKTHSWHCQSSCAITGEGLWEGLKWIADTLKHRQQGQSAGS